MPLKGFELIDTREIPIVSTDCFGNGHHLGKQSLIQKFEVIKMKFS